MLIQTDYTETPCQLCFPDVSGKLHILIRDIEGKLHTLIFQWELCFLESFSRKKPQTGFSEY